MATEAVARPAATILLVRDGTNGLEVFMVVRHHAIDFASGALVFPGGRVDENDHDVASQPDLCPNPDCLLTTEMAFRVAGVRETFEECGVLFARPRGEDALIGADQLRQVEETHRAPLANGEIGFDAVLTAHNLLPATDLLVPFAHWITPAHQPKRYNTQFFLAPAPSEHLAVHDGHESVDSVWMTPQQVIAETKSGRFKLVFATEMNLMKLAQSATVAEAIAAAQAAPVVTVQPQVVSRDGTRRKMRIPLEAGYGGEIFDVDNPPASGG